MPILNIDPNQPGKSGVFPRIILIQTNDSVATVTAPGYINSAQEKGMIAFRESDLCAVITQESASAPENAAWYEVSYESGVWSLIPPGGPGDVDLPTVANRLAHFTNTTGTLSSVASDVVNLGDLTLGESGTEGILRLFPTTAARGSWVLQALANTGDTVTTLQKAAMGQTTTFTLPDPGVASTDLILANKAGGQTIDQDVTITSGDLQVSDGSIRAGQGGTGGFYQAYSPDGSGVFTWHAINNGGGSFGTILTTAASYGQNQTITIPDAAASTANLLLDSGPANILSWESFVGVEDLLLGSGGTWNIVRLSQGNFVFRHTVADEADIIGIDVTPTIRTAASKGFRLNSFDVIYGIGTGALDAHSVTLDRVEYANATAVNVTSIPITGGTLATAIQATPYVTNVTVDTPVFANTTQSKYVMELNIDNSATSVYDLYGVVLKFSQTIA